MSETRSSDVQIGGDGCGDGGERGFTYLTGSIDDLNLPVVIAAEFHGLLECGLDRRMVVLDEAALDELDDERRLPWIGDQMVWMVREAMDVPTEREPRTASLRFLRGSGDMSGYEAGGAVAEEGRRGREEGGIEEGIIGRKGVYARCLCLYVHFQGCRTHLEKSGGSGRPRSTRRS
jgi:hypothetical protein